MKEKIKTLIVKIKIRIRQNKCYNKMEGSGDAAFGMCCGKWHEVGDSTFPAKQCEICRYLIRSKHERTLQQDK